jgi:Ca2+-binding EF-hand superfamily protein
MKRILLGSIAAATLAAATVAIAQPVAPEPVIQPVAPASPLRVLQPQTRNAVVDKVRAHFARLDTDRDGYLTKAEAQAGRAAMKAHRGQWAGRKAGGQRDHGAMFERLDANRDGSISREEFDRGHQRRQAMRDRDGDGQPDRRMLRMRGHGGGMRLGGQMFEQADLNRDSRVSLQEATEAAVRRFDMGDLNRDGTLAPEERQQMRTRMKEMHRVTRPS